MKNLWNWLEGKKTLLAGGGIALVAVAGVCLGKISVVDGIDLVFFGAAVAGYADKLNRHHSEVLAALQDIAKVGTDVRLHRYGAVAADVAKLEPMAIDMASGPKVSLTVHADTVDELVDHLTTGIPAPAHDGGTAR